MGIRGWGRGEDTQHNTMGKSGRHSIRIRGWGRGEDTNQGDNRMGKRGRHTSWG